MTNSLTLTLHRISWHYYRKWDFITKITKLVQTKHFNSSFCKLHKQSLYCEIRKNSSFNAENKINVCNMTILKWEKKNTTYISCFICLNRKDFKFWNPMTVFLWDAFSKCLDKFTFNKWICVLVFRPLLRKQFFSQVFLSDYHHCWLCSI